MTWNKKNLFSRGRWSSPAPAWALAASLMLCLPCIAAAAGTEEYQVKAAFVYNFTQFIDWPDGAFDSADAPFVVAIVGDDPFDGAMEDAMANKVKSQHPIVVKHFSSVDKIGSCQILFVPATLDDSLPDILKKVGSSPVLIIGESDAILPAGGAIRLFVEDQHMRFEINPDVLAVARLQASAKLLSLARIFKK
jgi:YfiR/HmsC-like